MDAIQTRGFGPSFQLLFVDSFVRNTMYILNSQDARR